MTIKDVPRAYAADIMDEWTENPDFAFGDDTSSVNPAPDRVGSTNPDENTTRFEWDIDLTPEEEQTFDDIVASVKAALRKDDYATIKSEIQTLRAYYQNPTPTNQDSVTALKDLIKVVKVLLRDEG